MDDEAGKKDRFVEHPTEFEDAIDRLVLSRGSDRKVTQRDLFLFRAYNGWQNHDVFSREFLRRISKHSEIEQAAIENRLTDLRFTLVDTDAEAILERKRREAEAAAAVEEYARRANADMPRRHSSFWNDFTIKAAIVIGFSLLIVMCVGVGPVAKKPESREEQLAREMREGQKAVCDRWGKLVDGC